MNINEISEKLNVSKNTLRYWEEHFSIPIRRDSRGRRRYTEDDLNLLLTIKSLREEDDGLNTISRKLSPVLNKNKIVHEVEVVNESAMQTLDNIEENIISTIDAKLDNIIEISEKYAKSCHYIGKLEAQLSAKDEKIEMLSDTSSRDLSNLRKELLNKEVELASALDEIETLKKDLEKERRKPWWKKIFS